jgi:hypothetical protein
MSTVLGSEKAIAAKPPAAPQTIFWYRELPPLSAEPVEEHTVEASSVPVPGRLAYRDELWSSCYGDAVRKTALRLEQEITRLGGRYAHVLAESVSVGHAPATGEAWLHITLTYMLYK